MNRMGTDLGPRGFLGKGPSNGGYRRGLGVQGLVRDESKDRLVTEIAVRIVAGRAQTTEDADSRQDTLVAAGGGRS